ncbi:MAG: TldD/PmbA family protein [Anaerolineae bacterium]|nr:TldD/PmbA family protein [Anaerolineae bacterium]
MTDYLQLAQQVVEQAAQGVEAEAFIMDEISTHITVDQHRVEQLSQSGSKGIGVRIIDHGRTGYAYTSDFSEESLQATIRAARELAEIATPDPDRTLPDPQPISEEDLEIFDPGLAQVSTEDKIALTRRAETATFDADARVFNARTDYIDYLTQVSIANSKGIAGAYSRTLAYFTIRATARDTELNDQAFGFGLDISNFFRELNPERAAKEAAYRATMTLGASTIPTQVASVVFDPFVMGQLLATLSLALSADAMQRGRSFLNGRMGEEIGVDLVTLMDNGRLKRGLGSAPFDGEGVPTSANRLVDEGVLQNLMYDTYTARRAGTQSTGNAARGSHRTLPTLRPNNFYIQPGHQSPEQIIAGVERGLYVTRIMQTGGINPINGDCSMAASGMLIENGQLTRPVNGVTLATTLPDLLRNISAVGDDLVSLPFFGSIGSPTVRVDQMTIGGSE